MTRRWPVFFWENENGGKEVKEIVKRLLMLLTVALVVVAMFVATAAPAFAKVETTNPAGNKPKGESKGNPALTPSGTNCPPGKNKDKSPGAAKKCP